MHQFSISGSNTLSSVSFFFFFYFLVLMSSKATYVSHISPAYGGYACIAIYGQSIERVDGWMHGWSQFSEDQTRV